MECLYFTGLKPVHGAERVWNLRKILSKRQLITCVSEELWKTLPHNVTHHLKRGNFVFYYLTTNSSIPENGVQPY